MSRSLLPLLLLLSTTVVAEPSPTPSKLRLAGGEFRPAAGARAPEWYRAAYVKTSPLGDRYLVAITSEPLGSKQRQRMESAGAELLGYLPERGYRLRVSPRAEGKVRALPFVEWLGELPPQYKVLPQVAEKAARATESAKVRIVLSAGEPNYRVLAALGGLAATSAPSGKDGAWRVTATLPAKSLAQTLSALAALPEVEAIESVRPIVPLNQDGVWVHQSFVGPAPQSTPIFDQGIFGCDQVVSVADTAQDYDSCYFADTVNGPPPVYACVTPPCPAEAPDPGLRKSIIYYNWSTTPDGEEDTCPTLLLGSSGHGTHTSGSAVGDGAPYADCASFTTPNRNGGDGQAPGARLVMLELGDGVEYLNDLGGTIWNIADVAYQSGARIHSFSFGGVCHDILGQCVPGCTLPYDSLARDADLAMWSHPDLLLVNAAGNAGLYCPAPMSVSTPATAKSLLVVGGTEHGVSATDVMPESSRGPVFDGRLRPTVVAQGRSVVSAASDASLISDNCASCSLDGTSMSAPSVAGLAALVREYYTAGFYATGSRNPGQGFTPSGALVKATLIDGAVDLATAGPDFESGYGRVLLESTLLFTGSSSGLRVDDHRVGATTGSAVNHAYDVAGTEPFRATLVWSDYPADLNAAVARVNELKLEVIDPNGDVWFQTLDPITGLPIRTMDPLDVHDGVNTEERLVFPNPTPGSWVVRVIGVDVPWGPQPFALVVRGAVADCAAPAALGAPALTTPADRQVQISWSVVGGAMGYNVYRSFGSCPGGPWIPVATGVSGTSFIDTTVSGGVSYSYYVVAASDAGGFCESPPSPCASTVPTGECTLLPDFRGLTSSSSNGTASCSITLDWNPGTAKCIGDVVYNVYRGISLGFSPDPAHLVAPCVSGTSYADTDNLVYGTDYYYKVRAEDATTGHGGPCRGGNEDANLVESMITPDGPPQFGGWGDDAGDSGEAKFELGQAWSIDDGAGDSGPKAYRVASSQLACTDLTSPILTLADPGQGPQLSFSTKHNLDYDPGFILFYEGSIGQVEIATGPSFSNWTRVPLTPDYPAFIDAPFYNNCTSTQAIGNYFSDIDMVYDTYAASLVNWGGQDVRIRFHLSGDLYFYGGDWWIDDVQVTQVAVPGSCTTVAAGPPPVPDGFSVAGAPLEVSKSGSDLMLTWDAGQCAAPEVNVYQGGVGDYTTFTDAHCGLPATGLAMLSIPDDSWFLVVATDGSSADGSWSRDFTGDELNYTGSSAVCPSITEHISYGTCEP